MARKKNYSCKQCFTFFHTKEEAVACFARDNNIKMKCANPGCTFETRTASALKQHLRACRKAAGDSVKYYCQYCCGLTGTCSVASKRGDNIKARHVANCAHRHGREVAAASRTTEAQLQGIQGVFKCNFPGCTVAGPARPAAALAQQAAAPAAAVAQTANETFTPGAATEVQQLQPPIDPLLVQQQARLSTKFVDTVLGEVRAGPPRGLDAGFEAVVLSSVVQSVDRVNAEGGHANYECWFPAVLATIYAHCQQLRLTVGVTNAAEWEFCCNERCRNFC